MSAAFPHRVLHFERIDSTNAEARRLAEAGDGGPVWIRADEQTGGRGRLGRTWVSEPGNLYATCLFQTTADSATATQLSFVAAVAVRETAVRLHPDIEPTIKWPNDLLLQGAKFCGILAEVVAQSPVTVAVGCGINLAHAPQGLPYPVACLGALDTDKAFTELKRAFERWCAIWADGRGFAVVRAEWQSHAAGIDEPCITEQGAGIFRGLAADGALILERADGSRVSIHSGEVRFAAVERMRQT